MAIAVLLCATLSWDAHAEVASATGYGAQIDLNVAGLGLLNQGPLPPGATGSGSTSFGPIHDETTGLSLPLALLGGISTGLLTGDVSYDNPAHLLSAAGGVANPDVGVNVLGLLGLRIVADAVESTGTITGSCGNLAGAGSAQLVNARLIIGATTVPLPVNPAPNTGIDGSTLGLPGLTLLLNEQTIGGNGTATRTVATNALRITLNLSAVGGATAIAGDIVFGHSEASVQCNTANLSISKSASPDPVVVGQILNYTVAVTNNGPDTATAASIQDTLPASVTVNSALPSNGGTCSQSANVLTCVWASIPNGATRQVIIAVVPSVTGSITNSAVAAQDDFDPNLGNNTASTSTTVNPPLPGEADLSVSKAANPNPVLVGQNLAYTLMVTNAGPDAATNITLTDNLPSGLPAPSITPGPFSCNVSGSTVTCTLASLASGASAQVLIQVVPPAPGVIANSVTVSSNVGDPDSTNNSTSISTLVSSGIGNSNLSLTKTASPNPIATGQTLTYTLTVSNAGPDTATNVVLIDNLPTGLAVTSIAPGPFSCSQSGLVITCSLASLLSGASSQVIIRGVPTRIGDLTNSATVGSDQNDPVSANNGANVSTQAYESDRSIIPTLNQWGVLLMLGMLAVAGWLLHPSRKAFDRSRP